MAESRPTNVTSASGAAARTKQWLPLYIRLCAAVGAVVIAESLLSLRWTSSSYEWLLFAGLGILTGTFSMKIGSVSASVTVSDTFFITTALLFGPGPATLAIALSSFVASMRRRHGWDRVRFNTATTAVSMWAGSHVFFWIGAFPPLTQAQVAAAQLILPLLCLTSVYFVMNTGLLAVAMGLD